MKILALRLSDGSISLLEAPSPVLAPGFVRVNTLHSAVSPGTEGGKVAAGQKSLLGKARSRPDQVRQVLDMARTVGLQATIQKVRSKLEGAQPLGYSLSGVVMELGAGVTHVRPGDIVACGGGGYANHADEVVVPANLAVPVPDGVAPEAAAMATLGAIALQGVRLAAPTLGENAVVIGLGVIGLLSGQLLKASGCRVFGVDLAPAALDFALQTGSADAVGRTGDDPLEAMIEQFSRGRGADMVLICAATSSDEPVELAGRVSRKRGRVVIVGAVGMNVPREDYYSKELPLVVSCSYGPGRYDPSYEEGGLDYPAPFVRWTEQRNIEAFLDMAAAGRVRPLDLVTHRLPFADAPRAYRMIADRSESFAGILLDYAQPAAGQASSRAVSAAGSAEASAAGQPRPIEGGKVGIGFVGAGSYAQAFLLPPLKASGQASFTAIFTRTGTSAVDVCRRYGFARVAGSLAEVVGDPNTQAVFVATRHDQHAAAVLAALRAGRHVFVEKPLCLALDELREIAAVLHQGGTGTAAPVLQVGYNRRFAPATQAARRHLGRAPGPLTMMYRVSAGVIPREHWIQDPQQGGGRILGEVCHFVDLMQALCGACPVLVAAHCVDTPSAAAVPEDDVLLQFKFADGSVGAIGYFAHGAKSLPKERLEVSAAGRTAVIDNFGAIELYSARGRVRRPCGGKGQKEEIAAFLMAIRTGTPAIPYDSQLATSLATLAALESLREGKTATISIADLGVRP